MCWFKKFGWVYLPQSMTGVVIFLLFTAAAVHDLVIIGSRSHSAGDTYYGFLPYFAAYFFFYNWIASNTAIKNESQKDGQSHPD